MDINTFTNNLNELSLRGIRYEPMAQRIELWDTYTGLSDKLGLIQIHDKAYAHSPDSNRENVWMYSLASDDPRVYAVKDILIFGVANRSSARSCIAREIKYEEFRIGLQETASHTS